ncbi:MULTISPECIES: thermonuclease family protein [unclassified Mycoplasma]|uniref:thermonuclease family protein n=1 Tax=unclassified Mycoplasma TaxID=2683645 RepID=UPI00211CAC75|nr:MULTISPECIES: thermonuclease family protein [unclassified Mycoplasma]UUM20000.1 thermonuclease family protein [Mycoplasma sp. 1578d]UUM24981.1 thermonuclease family protein [Mycoplasma sp. 3686d]
MWRIIILLKILFLTLLSVSCASANVYLTPKNQVSIPLNKNNNLEKGKVLQIYDGDTILVQTDRSTMSLRFYGIDTPETFKPGKDEKLSLYEDFYAQKSTKYLQSLISINQEIYFTQQAIDKYNRTIAILFTNSEQSHIKQSINFKLVEQGWARVAYICYSKCHEYNVKNDYQKEFLTDILQAQSNAKFNKRGIWAQQEALVFHKKWTQK